MEDFTIVVGLDAKTIAQFRLTWPTWVANKPSLLKRPMIIFYDHLQVKEEDVLDFVSHDRLSLVSWPPPGAFYHGNTTNKWDHPQRAKMLAGFIFVAADHVKTDYWLKLDTDVIAIGLDDWIDSEWFHEWTSIVAPGWGYTKPPTQMMKLDQWAEKQSTLNPRAEKFFSTSNPLNLVPMAGENKVKHKRICSWCAFFHAEITRKCRDLAWCGSYGTYSLPVPSQDGFMWYMAKRGGYNIERVDMKSRGWIVRNGLKNIEKTIEELHG